MAHYLDNLLKQHSEWHKNGTDTIERCEDNRLMIKHQIMQLAPTITSREVDTLFWLARNGSSMLADMFLDAAQLYHIASFLPAYEVCVAVKRTMVKYLADSEYVTAQLKAAGVECYQLLELFNLTDDEDRQSLLDLFDVDKSDLSPGGKLAHRVTELLADLHRAIETNAVDHTDGAFTATTLATMGCYADEVSKICSAAAMAVKHIQDRTLAEDLLAFEVAMQAAAAEGADLQRRYPSLPFFQLRNDESGMEAQRIALLPLQYAAAHGGLEGFDETPMREFAQKHNLKPESPIARMLRDAGMPADIIAVFEA